jgi:hypothetical protein
MAVADVDQDGNLDVLLTRTDTLRIFLTDATGGFTESTGWNDLQWLDPGRQPVAMATGDVNGDGYVDLLATDGIEVRLFLNRGSVDAVWAGFELQADRIAIRNLSTLLLEDLNDDGLLDLVATTSAGLEVRLGEPSARFGEPVNYGGDAWPLNNRQAAIGDVDGDGDLDIVRPGRDGLLLNDGSGFFEPTGGTLLSAATEVALADVNGDQALDLILVMSDEVVSISLNDGFGGFASDPIRYPVIHGGSDLTVGDFDGDGDQDFVIAQRRVTHASPYWQHGGIDLTFLNSGTGHFQSPVVGIGNHSRLTMRNRHGEDLLLHVSHEYPSTLIVATYRIQPSRYLADSAQVFLLDNPDLSNDANLVDLNGDGRPDALINVQRQDHLFALTLQADGQFRAQRLETGQSTFALANDVTGDGQTDIVTVAGLREIHVFSGDDFSDVAISSEQLGGINRSLFDLNGDGLLDLVTFGQSTTGPSTVDVAWNQGGGRFAPSVEVDTISAGRYWPLALDDSNDLRLLVLDKSSGLLYEHSFLADGTLSPPTELPVDHPGAIADIADVDRDGYVDLITVSAEGHRYQTFRTQDAGPFRRATILNRRGIQSPPIDVDWDGMVDYLFTVPTRGLLSYRQHQGDGTLGPERGIPYPLTLSDAAVADLDMNGYWDAVYAIHQPESQGGGLVVVYGSEHGPLRTEFVLFAPSGVAGMAHTGFFRPVATQRSLQIADIDGDGDLDIVTTGWRGASVVKNEIAQRFAPGDLNHDGLLDADDPDTLCYAIQSGVPNPAAFDRDRNGTLDLADLHSLLREQFATRPGDANLDGRFDSADLVAVFQRGAYNDPNFGTLGWSAGDWNCDGRFDSQDLVLAFIAGFYEETPAPTTDVARTNTRSI